MLIIGWLEWHLDNNVCKSDNTRALLIESAEFASDLAMELGQRLATIRLYPFDANRAVAYEDHDAKIKGEDADA